MFHDKVKGRLMTLLHTAIIGLILAVATGCAMHTNGLLIARDLPERSALVVLDIQKDFVGPDAKLPVDSSQADIMIRNTNLLIDAFAKEGREVVYIVNEFSESDTIANWFRNGAAVEGTTGAALSEELQVVGDARFSKSQSDAFSNPFFDSYLRRNNISEVVLAGVFADYCVLATARGAIQRGFSVITISDAVATNNDKALAGALKKHGDAGSKVVNTSAVLGGMQTP